MGWIYDFDIKEHKKFYENLKPGDVCRIDLGLGRQPKSNQYKKNKKGILRPPKYSKPNYLKDCVGNTVKCYVKKAICDNCYLLYRIVNEKKVEVGVYSAFLCIKIGRYKNE